MKQVTLQVNVHPVSLVLQIEPVEGQLVEATLVTHTEIGGHLSRRDLWWQEMPVQWREHAQLLINEAINSAFIQEGLHNAADRSDVLRRGEEQGSNEGSQQSSSGESSTELRKEDSGNPE